jgi:hypothetical protein
LFRLLSYTLKYQHMTQYNTSAQQVKIYDEISLVESVAPNCWEIDQCFSPDTLKWLQDIVVNDGNEFEVTRPHHRLWLKPGTDYNRLQQIGLDIIPELNKLTGKDLNLMIVKYWLDLPNFGCQPHSDSLDIVVTYQVYVDVHSGSDQPCHGVEFMHVDPAYEIAIKPNHGYINLNVDSKLHQVIRGSGTRTSVVFQYNVCN